VPLVIASARKVVLNHVEPRKLASVFTQARSCEASRSPTVVWSRLEPFRPACLRHVRQHEAVTIDEHTVRERAVVLVLIVMARGQKIINELVVNTAAVER
jgi:hypothetical protein